MSAEQRRDGVDSTVLQGAEPISGKFVESEEAVDEETAKSVNPGKVNSFEPNVVGGRYSKIGCPNYGPKSTRAVQRATICLVNEGGARVYRACTAMVIVCARSCCQTHTFGLQKNVHCLPCSLWAQHKNYFSRRYRR